MSPEPTSIEVEPAAHAHTLLADTLRPHTLLADTLRPHTLLADTLRLRLSGNHAAKDQQDRNAFQLATTSCFSATGHPTIKFFIPRGTGLIGEENGGDDGGDNSDEEVTVLQKKRKCH